MNFCEILKYLRAEKGVTQKEVAIACDLTPTCICQLETGARNPTGSTIKALAIYFNCSADYLLGLEDDFGNVVVSGQTSDLSKSDKELLDVFHSLGPFEQESIRIQIKALASARSEVIKK